MTAEILAANDTFTLAAAHRRMALGLLRRGRWARPSACASSIHVTTLNSQTALVNKEPGGAGRPLDQHPMSGNVLYERGTFEIFKFSPAGRKHVTRDN